MRIVYAVNDQSYRRHITLDSVETLCGREAGRHESLALPVNCDECRSENGRQIKARQSAEG
ncbi:hypothetical protein ACFPM3_20150 [Streptomyces coeruleoprunus]|uniref:Uncharacterized protein n=1 Tax=Streptomyces coeruleoprunus TaxID=285563 RepID=A0ABV9XHH4_9ACTN